MNNPEGKLRLDIPVLLPHVRDDADACIKRLQDDLTGRPGIDAYTSGRGRVMGLASYACILIPRYFPWHAYARSQTLRVRVLPKTLGT